MLSFDEMLVMTEMLYRNGLNLYTYVGAWRNHGETLHLLCGLLATPRQHDQSGLLRWRRDWRWSSGAIYEIGNRRYPGNRDIEALLRSVNRGAEVHVGLLCCPTLVSGDEIESVDE